MDTNEIGYLVLQAIDQRQRQHPSGFVSDDQIVEDTQLDMQTVRDEMDLLLADG